jgi:excisionase family DNA binding protein
MMSTVLTLDEVAAFLKVHSSTIYRLLKHHRIPAFKMGSDWRFNQDSIERWIEEREAINEPDQPSETATATGLSGVNRG